MKLEFIGEDEGKVWFVLWCHYVDRDIAKAAGFQWCPGNKVWQTTDISIARTFVDYATPETVAFLNPPICRHGIKLDGVFCFTCAREIRNEGRELDAEFREAIDG